MEKGKVQLTQKDAENTPAGGVVVGKRDGQTMIYDDASLGGYFVGKLHKDGGIKMVNKSTGQPLEVQGSEVIITAPAVSDQTKREFEGKMMTNREILSAINEKGGGVSFAEGGEVPERFTPSGASYNYGGKTMTDHEILKAMNGSGHLSKNKSLKQIAEMHNVSLAHINEELEKGLEVEKEHFADFKERTRVAKDHLVENPSYYTILEKAGLKMGGHIQKQDLVENSKKGDTPARDLNNYNDLLDVQADSNVGADNGLAFAKGGLVTKDNLKNIEKEFLALTDNSHYKGIYDEDEIDDGVALEWGKYGYSVSEDQQDEDYKMLRDATAKFNAKNIGKLYANAELGDKYNTVTILDYDMLANDSQLVSILPEKYFAKLKVGRANNRNVAERIKQEADKLKDLEAVEVISKKLGVTDEKANNILFSLKYDKEYYEKNKKQSKPRFDVFSSRNFPRKDFENLEQTLDYIQSDAFANSVYMSTGYGNPISEGTVHLYGWGALSIEYKQNNFPFRPDGSTDFYKDRTTTLKIHPYLAVNVSSKQDFMNSFKKAIDDFVWCYNYYVLGANKKNKAEEAEDLSELLKMVQSGDYADGGLTPYDANAEGDSIDMLDTGGGVGLPKVAYVKISNTGASLKQLLGLKYNSYKEFKESVQEAYKPFVNVKPIRRSFVEIEAYDENGKKLVDANTYIADQKNTVKNFNPTTGNYKNLEKSLANSRPRIFQKFDWEDWFLSKVKPSTTNSQTPTSSNLPLDLSDTKVWIGDDERLSKAIQEVAFELGWSWYGGKNVTYTEKDSLFFFSNKLIEFGEGRKFFDKDGNKEINPQDILLAKKAVITTSSSNSGSNKPFDFTDTKINVKNNPTLSRRVQKIAFENGWEWEGGGGKTIDYNTDNYLYFTKKSISDGITTSSFRISPKREITEAEIFGSQGSNLAPYEASQVTLEWENLQGIDQTANFYTDGSIGVSGRSGQGLINFLKKIEKDSNGKDVEVVIQANAKDKNGNNVIRRTEFTIGETWFKPSTRTNEQIKSIVANDYIDGITFDKFFEDVIPLSGTQTSSEKIVQSVLVNYAGGQQYVALNEQKLLDKIVELWKSGGRSTMTIVLQPQGFVTTISSPLNILLDTIRASKNSVQPSTLSISELKAYLSIEWYPELDWSDFFEDAQTPIQYRPFDLSQTKIKVGADRNLSKKIQEKAFELGWGWNSGIVKDVQSTGANYLFFDDRKQIEAHYTEKSFKEAVDYREITVDELFGTPKTTSTSAQPFDFSETKIWIGDNPELSKRVQEKAFESGYKWSGLDNFVQSTDKYALYFIGISKVITFGSGDYKRFNEDNSFKEITEEDIFGTPNTTSKPVVPKSVAIEIYDFDEAVKKLEKASSEVATKYNTEIYEKSLKFLYDTKATYELTLKFTPESAFMYERLDILRKLADLEKNIKKIEDMKKGGTFYILAKILEKLQSGENWRTSENAQDVITNKLPQSEIDVIIRSQKFKNWFGDWEKALFNDEYDNVSKALTNGLPSVYHHGARRIKYTYREVSNGVLYLAENISYAIWFSQNSTAQNEEGNYLTDCFVNIKNPIDLTAFKVSQIDLADLVKYIDAIYPLAKIYDYIPAQVALLIKTNQPTNIRMWAWQLIRNYTKFVKHIKENTPYDGFLYYENNPSDQVINPVTGQSEENVTKAVAIFKSHQVKVVDAVLFDGGLDDWRFENGGKINN